MSPLKRAGFAFLSLLLVLALLEALLRAAYPLYKDYNTEMWRYSSRLKRLSDHPGLPFEHAPDMRGTFYGVEIRTNNAGWRSGRPAVLAKPAGVKRALLIGDSQTLGWGVSEEDTFAGLLQRRLGGGVEVMNAGVGNYNLAAEAAMLRKSLAYRPDLVVLSLTINDAELLEKVNPALLFFMKRSYLYGYLWDRLSLLGFWLGLARPYEEYYRGLYRPGSPELASFEAAARDVLAAAAGAGVPLLVMDIPELHGFKDYPFAEIAARKRALFSGAAAFIDPLGSFLPREPRGLWVSAEDPHPNAEAHGLLAEALLREIEAKGWLR